MSDSNFYEELLILEDETIDRYVRGAMSEADSASFQSYFLQSPEHRQKLRFARALSKYVDRALGESTGEFNAEAAPAALPEQDSAGMHPDNSSAKARGFWWPFQTPALNYALAAVVVIAIVGIAWVALRSSRPAGPGNVFEATLVPGGITREGGAIQTISIPPGADTVRLRLILPPDQYQDYGIQLLASDGTSLRTLEGLKSAEASGQKSLQVDIPAQLLRRDTYKLKLSGSTSGSYEKIASYNFRVIN
ncbi:MAG TPA: hypothetical protein VNG71_08215 [Pyrinomonadaceae bacterium]|nr:hypothetical protein [Pyrinomonadaceae bacterium]